MQINMFCFFSSNTELFEQKYVTFVLFAQFSIVMETKRNKHGMLVCLVCTAARIVYVLHYNYHNNTILSEVYKLM